MEDKRSGDEGEAIVQHYQTGVKLHSGGIHVGGVRGKSHSITAGGQLQE